MRWSLRDSNRANLDYRIDPIKPDRDSRLEYAVVKFYEGDTNGITLSDFGTHTVRSGNQVVHSARTVAQIGRLNDHQLFDPRSRADIPGDLNEAVDILSLIPYSDRLKISEMARGPVHVTNTTDGSQTLTRTLDRQITEYLPEERKQARALLGFPTDDDAIRLASDLAKIRDINPALLPVKLHPPAART
jgi:hypothetical protein